MTAITYNQKVDQIGGIDMNSSVFIPPTPEKVLDIDYIDGQHERRAQEALLALHSTFHEQLDQYQQFRIPKQESCGAVFIGLPAFGKTTACNELARITTNSWVLGKDQEELITYVWRDGWVPMGSRLADTYGCVEGEDDALARLILFCYSKMEERMKLNAIYYILSKNGVIPIANGDLLQLDLSFRAYAGIFLDNSEPLLQLELVPWHPQRNFIVCPFGGKIKDEDEVLAEIFLRAARQGEDSCKSENALERFRAGRESLNKRNGPLKVGARLIQVYQAIMTSMNHPLSVISTENMFTIQNLLRSIMLHPIVPELNILGIINDTRLSLPELEPGAIISHLRQQNLLLAIQDPITRQALCNEVRNMQVREGNYMASLLPNGHFIKYLRERRLILQQLLAFS